MEEGNFLRCEETPFAATDVLLGQSGKGHAVEVDHLVPYFLEDTAYDAVLSGVDLQTDMTAVRFGELESVGRDALVVQYDAGTNDRLIHLFQLAVERNGVDLLLVELGMGQLGCQITVIGEQQHTGRVAVETTYRVDALGTGVTDDINDRMTFLRVISRGDGVLGFVEQNIYLALTANRLVMETDIIRRQHFDAEVIDGHPIDGDDTCLNEIICLTTRAYTCVSKELVQTYRLGRILVLLTIDLLLVRRIDAVIAFGTLSERTVRALGALTAERTLRTIVVVRTLRTARTIGTFTTERTLRTLAVETKGFRSVVVSLTGKSRTSRYRLTLSAKTRTGSAFAFIVGIVKRD